MIGILREERFNFVSERDKAFMLAFNDQMARLGYDFGNKIGDGFCWGKYMVIYRKSGVKSKACMPGFLSGKQTSFSGYSSVI